MALQNSALKWASDHRDHHRYVDRSWDPYDIRRGGLWAHILWLFYREPPQRVYENVPDLKANRLVRWQFRLNNWIGIIAGLGLPTLAGSLFGRPVGGLLWGGFLRIVVIHHTTFLVNSVAHLYGSRPYTEENSARDNAILAFVTNGEGVPQFSPQVPLRLPQRISVVSLGSHQVADRHSQIRGTRPRSEADTPRGDREGAAADEARAGRGKASADARRIRGAVAPAHGRHPALARQLGPALAGVGGAPNRGAEVGRPI